VLSRHTKMWNNINILKNRVLTFLQKVPASYRFFSV